MATLPASTFSWTFVSTSLNGAVPVVITSTTQKIVASASAGIGHNGATAVYPVGIVMCYRLGTTGTVTAMDASNWVDNTIVPGSIRTSISTSGTVTGLAPGTYYVGVGFTNNTTQAMNVNDYTTGWVMVTN